jgi:hypothetical protein
MAHAYNPVYSGGRDQEDHGSPYLENTHHKMGWQSGLR